jgi:histone deacetylase 1/2
MKPTRIRMCHSLVMNYGLYKKMEIFVRSQLLEIDLKLIVRGRNPLRNERCHSSIRTNTSTFYTRSRRTTLISLPRSRSNVRTVILQSARC